MSRIKYPLNQFGDDAPDWGDDSWEEDEGWEWAECDWGDDILEEDDDN